MADQHVAHNSACSDFALKDLVQQARPMTLYLAVTPGDTHRLGGLVRLFIAQVTVRLMEELPDEGGRHRLLLLLDELPAFGKVRSLEEAIPICAGYGVKLYTIIQNIEQLERTYGRNNAIFPNSEVRSAYAPNTYATAQLLSNMAGRTTAHIDTQAASVRPLSMGASSINEGQQEVGRPLIDPGECITLPPTVTRKERGGQTAVVDPGQMLVFVTGLPPILGSKVQHYSDPGLLSATQREPAVARSGGLTGSPLREQHDSNPPVLPAEPTVSSAGAPGVGEVRSGNAGIPDLEDLLSEQVLIMGEEFSEDDEP